MAQLVKSLPTMQKTQVQSVAWEGEGNSNPLQYSCLENPMDRRAWQATVLGGRKESNTTQQLNDNQDKQGMQPNPEMTDGGN